MKKIAFACFLALASFIVLPSCKKDYTCSCTYTANGQSTSVTAPINNSSKKDAKNACQSLETTYSMYTNAHCELK